MKEEEEQTGNRRQEKKEALETKRMELVQRVLQGYLRRDELKTFASGIFLD